MENFWTSNKTINGLRHFVLVNETKEKGNVNFFMVSVIDHTFNNTNLNSSKVNDHVNIEYDYLSRFVLKNE